MRLLAIGAHPDDLEIYTFGSLMAWREMGAELILAVATDGAAGGQMPPEGLRKTRRAEAINGAAALGAEPHFMDFADGTLLADRPLIEALRSLIAARKPDLILTHSPNDYHSDHRALSNAMAHAVGFSAPLLYMDTLNGTGFVPTHYVSVTDHFGAKETAIRAHLSQDPERFVTNATRQAAFRAGECNGGPNDRAEAFRFDPRFPFGDIRELLPPAPPVRAVILRGNQ